MTSAQDGDSTAWAELVVRYQPLVNSVTRRYRLSEVDAADASQTVWTKLVENLARLREPRALPGWIRTTTTRVSLQALKSVRRVVAMDPTESENYADRWGDQFDIAQDMLRAECRRALRSGLAELAQHERDLLVLLVADPPLTYQQISSNLGLPMGSIGPSRARCLKKLRASTAIRTLELTAEPAGTAA